MAQPTLFLTVGLPSTGKTTAARRIETEHHALRLTKDEWVKALYGHENPPSARTSSRAGSSRSACALSSSATTSSSTSACGGATNGRPCDRPRHDSVRRSGAALLRARPRPSSGDGSTGAGRAAADDVADVRPALADWAAAFEVPTPGQLDGRSPSTTRRPGSRPGTSGAGTAGRRPCPDGGSAGPVPANN